MKNRRGFLAVAAGLLALVAGLIFWQPWGVPTARETGDDRFGARTPRPPSVVFLPSASAPFAAAPVAVPTPFPKTAAPADTRRPGTTPGTAAAPTPPNPQTEVEKVHRMIADYHTLMGENPVGTNAEIMRKLLGKNSHQATLGPPEGQTLNDKGELIDQWGTPFFLSPVEP